MRYYIVCDKENEEVVTDKMNKLHMKRAASIDDAGAFILIGSIDKNEVGNFLEAATNAFLLDLPISGITLDRFLALDKFPTLT